MKAVSDDGIEIQKVRRSPTWMIVGALVGLALVLVDLIPAIAGVIEYRDVTRQLSAISPKVSQEVMAVQRCNQVTVVDARERCLTELVPGVSSCAGILVLADALLPMAKASAHSATLQLIDTLVERYPDATRNERHLRRQMDDIGQKIRGSAISRFLTPYPSPNAADTGYQLWVTLTAMQSAAHNPRIADQQAKAGARL